MVTTRVENPDLLITYFHLDLSVSQSPLGVIFPEVFLVVVRHQIAEITAFVLQ